MKNVWDEVCVQVQGEQSAMWDAYLDTIEGLVSQHLSRVDVDVKRAIWLQTPNGMEWEPDEDDDDKSPYSDDDIVDYVLDEYVLSAAADWSNARIERHKEQW